MSHQANHQLVDRSSHNSLSTVTTVSRTPSDPEANQPPIIVVKDEDGNTTEKPMMQLNEKNNNDTLVPLPDPPAPKNPPFFSREYMMTNVDPARSTVPLAIWCFMTGFTDAVTYSAIFIWSGFQTGNTVQLSLALARLWQNLPNPLYPGSSKHKYIHDTAFHLQDRQALTSLLSFNVGSFVGRIGDKIGFGTRLWMFIGSFIQVLATMIACLTIHASHQPSVAVTREQPAWTNYKTFIGVGFLSAALGLQAIMAKRLNTNFSTTVVLTTVYAELVADPKLFQHPWNGWPLISRDHKVLGILSLFFGGVVGRTLVQSVVGVTPTLAIGCGIRLFAAVWWLFVPAKPPAKK